MNDEAQSSQYVTTCQSHRLTYSVRANSSNIERRMMSAYALASLKLYIGTLSRLWVCQNTIIVLVLSQVGGVHCKYVYTTSVRFRPTYLVNKKNTTRHRIYIQIDVFAQLSELTKFCMRGGLPGMIFPSFEFQKDRSKMSKLLGSRKQRLVATAQAVMPPTAPTVIKITITTIALWKSMD